MVAVGLAVLSVFVLGAASCSVAQPFAHNGMPTIQFEGDSITTQSADTINQSLSGSWDVAINALVGTTTVAQVGAITAQAALAPDVQ